MYAIISQLDTKSSETVRNLWQRLREVCGLKGIYNLPTPHMTWFSAEELDIPTAASIIANIAGSYPELATFAFGLGIFAGGSPVLYLPMVKSQAMIDLHSQIWDQVPQHANHPNMYYEPTHWLPHITLAAYDLSRENVACAMESVVFESIEMTVAIDNLIIVTQDMDPSSEVLHRYYFRG